MNGIGIEVWYKAKHVLKTCMHVKNKYINWIGTCNFIILLQCVIRHLWEAKFDWVHAKEFSHTCNVVVVNCNNLINYCNCNCLFYSHHMTYMVKFQNKNA